MDALLNLDSFMDIVTNVIGVLFFVLVYASLMAINVKTSAAPPPVIAKVEAHSTLTTPILSKGNTKPIVMTCIEGKVVYPRMEDLMDRVEKVIQSVLPDMALRDMSQLETIRARVEEQGIRSQNYEVHFQNTALRFTPVADYHGDSATALQDPDSQFRQALAGLNANQHHIFFIVDADSFDVFQTARKVAKDSGFKCGWEPKEKAAPILVGLTGGSGVVDVGSHF